MLFNSTPWKTWSILPIRSSYIMFKKKKKKLTMQEMSGPLVLNKSKNYHLCISPLSPGSICIRGMSSRNSVFDFVMMRVWSSSLLIGLGGEAAHPSEFCPDSQKKVVKIQVNFISNVLKCSCTNKTLQYVLMHENKFLHLSLMTFFFTTCINL